MGLWILVISSLFASLPAWAQQEGSIADCYSRAEGAYMFSSEKIITQLQAADIDNMEFERVRAEVIRQRERQLLACAQVENQQLQSQMSGLYQQLEAIKNDERRAPASLPPSYEEVFSRTEVSE